MPARRAPCAVRRGQNQLPATIRFLAQSFHWTLNKVVYLASAINETYAAASLDGEKFKRPPEDARISESWLLSPMW